jgi:hypothetical protein
MLWILGRIEFVVYDGLDIDDSCDRISMGVFITFELGRRSRWFWAWILRGRRWRF